MWSTMLILLIIFFLIGGIIFNLISTYTVNQESKTLTTTAKNVADFTAAWHTQAPRPKHFYDATINTFGGMTDTKIIVTNAEGYIVASNIRSQTLPKYVSDNYTDGALKGKTAKFIGSFDGVFHEITLTIASPIHIDNQVVGVVFASSSMPSLEDNKMEFFRLFIVVTLFVFIIACMVMYILSHKMTKSIQDISIAARALAAGNYKTPAKITGNDEIADLGRTFNQMAASLEQLDDTQTSFIANVSHELRTPMTTIAGFTENILNGTIPPEQQDKYLQIVLDESKRLSRMVSDMLDISKISLGQYSISKATFNLTELTRLLIIQYENAIDEKKLDVSVDFSEEAVNVYADRDAITRVITNIIDNAIKFSDPCGRLDISIRTNESKALVAIANEGIGIDPKDIAHVFDRFYKTDKSRNDKKGTGLGLHLVHNLLTLHGETIAVKSVDLSNDDFDGNENHPARRTTFIFTLALKK